jgi:hypothetical protein
MKPKKFKITLSNSAGELDSLNVLDTLDGQELTEAMGEFVSDIKFADGDVLTVEEIML